MGGKGSGRKPLGKFIPGVTERDMQGRQKGKKYLLLAYISVGPGSWAYVSKVMAMGAWDRVILFSDEKGMTLFSPPVPCDWVLTHFRRGFDFRLKEILDALPLLDKDWVVCVNLSSGTGAQHMVLLHALRQRKFLFKLALIKKDGVHLL